MEKASEIVHSRAAAPLVQASLVITYKSPARDIEPPGSEGVRADEIVGPSKADAGTHTGSERF